jgi:hypothetical protein
VTFPILFIMRNSKKPVSPKPTVAELQFLEAIRDHDAKALAEALLSVHELALYHSDIPIDRKEKEELYCVKVLAEELAKMG